MADLQPGQPIAETPAAGSAQTTPAPEPTLLEHEQQFHEASASSDEDDEAGDAGRTLNKRRHRAKKDQAGAGDVPRIQELTRKLREAESRATAPTAAPQAAPAAAVQRQPEPVAQPTYRPQPQQQAAQSFPEYEDFVQIQGYENTTYNQYLREQTAWVYRQQRDQERQQDALETRQRHEADRVQRHQSMAIPAARQKYPDWDAAIQSSAAVQVSPVMRAAIYESDASADITYWLATHPADAQQLAQESAEIPYQSHAVMRRYLESQVSSNAPRGAAVATGPALTLVPPPAPKPPSPVRTRALTPADDPPGETSSLYDHEKFYGTPRQRRRRA